MSLKIPQFCVSHTVRGTCTIVINSTSDGNKTITVPEGTYWVDPLFVLAFTASGDTRLHQVLGALIDTALGAATSWSLAAVSGYPTGFWTLKATLSAQPLDFKFVGASCNDEGRRLLHALGVDGGNNDPSANPASPASVTWTWPAHTWCPGRGDTSNATDEPSQYGVGTSLRLYGGSSTAFNLGRPQKRRAVRHTLLPGYLIHERTTYPGASFMELVWPFIAAGEQVRYYADKSCTVARLDGAITASQGTIIPGNVFGLNTAGQIIWVDGEPMLVVSESGGVLTVRRNPALAKAHASWVPVASDFVGSYVLDADSMKGIRPARSASRADIWDLDFDMVRSA